jgi:two-component system NtrC family sensor kinase
VLDVKMSMASLDGALAQTRNHVAWLTLAMLLIVGTGTVLFVIRVVRRPVLQLYKGTQRIAQGDLDTRIPVTTRDEVGRLAAAFNRMTGDLQRAREELMGWSHKLEREVKDKTAELGRIQRQVIHMEKMASLGKLSATVAHEINNPLAGILTYARLVEREVAAGGPPDDEREEVLRWLGLIRQETTRCGDIVRNLLLFARQSGKEFAPLHINELMKRSLMLVRHHTEIAGVELDAELIDGNDEVQGDADQIQQAVVALLVNAVEAMGGGEGRLTVRATGDDDSVEIRITDTGTGIPEDVLPHVFEPFFSTKDKESGVGLGLAVVYGIVQRHAGTIDVETEVGRGTTFHLRLHRRPAVPAQAA